MTRSSASTARIQWFSADSIPRFRCAAIGRVPKDEHARPGCLRAVTVSSVDPPSTTITSSAHARSATACGDLRALVEGRDDHAHAALRRAATPVRDRVADSSPAETRAVTAVDIAGSSG